MRFLADAGISSETVVCLTDLGHDAVHVRTLGLARAQDPDLMAHARQDGRIILAFDLDFGDLLALGNLTAPSVILLRLTDQRPAAVNARLRAVLPEHEAHLTAGAIVVVEDTQVRVRALPIGA